MQIPQYSLPAYLDDFADERLEHAQMTYHAATEERFEAKLKELDARIDALEEGEPDEASAAGQRLAYLYQERSHLQKQRSIALHQPTTFPLNIEFAAHAEISIRLARHALARCNGDYREALHYLHRESSKAVAALFRECGETKYGTTTTSALPNIRYAARKLVMQLVDTRTRKNVVPVTPKILQFPKRVQD